MMQDDTASRAAPPTRESSPTIASMARASSRSPIDRYTTENGSIIGSDTLPCWNDIRPRAEADVRMQGDGVFSDSAGNSWHGKFHNDTFLNESGSWVPVTSLAQQAASSTHG